VCEYLAEPVVPRPMLILLSALLAVGCARHFALHLDEHIQAVQLGLLKAVCEGASVNTNNEIMLTSATFTLQTSYHLGLGAPVGTTPVDVSGSGDRTGTVAVTVPFVVPPKEEACKQFATLDAKWGSRLHPKTGQEAQ
jgi:hypothetical protein